MLMDAVFGAKRFLSEINWVRTNAHNFQSRFFQRVSDILLFYSKSDEYTWNPQFQPYSEAQKKRYRLDPSTGRFYTGQDLTLMGISPSRQFEWRGVKPPKNRVWGYSREALEELWENGLILKRSDGSPRLDGRKVYLDEKPGKAITAVWDDVQRVGNTAAERLGYPTQKPVALLERIIQASSNEGDVILDPFCGCGTTIDAAQKLNRHWIGIDVTQLAVTLIKQRLLDTHEEAAVYQVLGEPVSLPDAEKLAETDPYQFQWWALGLVGARPVEEKKGADKGIDGKIIFQGDKPGTFESVILSVKAGKTAVPHVRDLRGVLEREKAAIGVLISLQEPTGPMKTEAVTAGFYESEVWGRKYPKVQLLTIAELLEGKRVDMPPIRQVGATFRKAPRAKDKQGEQQELEI